MIGQRKVTCIGFAFYSKYYYKPINKESFYCCLTCGKLLNIFEAFYFVRPSLMVIFRYYILFADLITFCIFFVYILQIVNFSGQNRNADFLKLALSTKILYLGIDQNLFWN